jgi:hypothetical protein
MDSTHDGFQLFGNPPLFDQFAHGPRNILYPSRPRP